jgi:hypothetical protein
MSKAVRRRETVDSVFLVKRMFIETVSDIGNFNTSLGIDYREPAVTMATDLTGGVIVEPTLNDRRDDETKGKMKKLGKTISRTPRSCVSFLEIE